MKRNLAERVAGIAEKMDRLLADLHDIGEELDDESERRALRRAIGFLVCEIHEKIRLPVLGQFPDLDPDRRSWLRP